MKDFLQGKQVKHPLHSALVHFPIALFFISFLCDLAGFIWPGLGNLVAAAFYSMALGVGTALLASIPGFVDYTDIRQDHPARKIATTHMFLNLAAVAVYGINLGLRYQTLDESRVPGIPFIFSLVGIVLLSFSGYLGGVMVYDNGIGVGRHRRKTRTPERTIKVESHEAQGPGGFVDVAETQALADGETLRVEVDGTVMVIAKVEGQFYAVQEFCTHRFGPLSEGTIHEGKIECPWHCSCFDLRTGKVAKGPAKLDLKTFPVRVSDGKIQVSGPQKRDTEFIAPPPKQTSRWRLFGRETNSAAHENESKK